MGASQPPVVSTKATTLETEGAKTIPPSLNTLSQNKSELNQDNHDTIPGMRWVTLGNHRRVALDDDGRVVRGLPHDARGVHVRDLSPFMREYRDLTSADCSRSTEGKQYRRTPGSREVLRGRGGEVMPARFESKDEALEALLRDNPLLERFVQDNWGSDSQAYKNWVLGGRRGPKSPAGTRRREVRPYPTSPHTTWGNAPKT